MSNFDNRFGSINRLYGVHDTAIIRRLHVCVVGLGGVGSWAAEALARTGIGALTLIDYDEVSLSNVNRQLHALTDTVGRKKVDVLAQRFAAINPDCKINTIEDFLRLDNLDDYMSLERGYDYVIDAMDSIKFKSGLINHCKRRKIPVVMVGGAGGVTDPTKITIADLSRTCHDPLAARVRSQLRDKYGFTSNPKRSFGIECVFSLQQKRYPKPDGSVSCEKPGIHGVSLDCNLGYGSVTYVTAVFGMIAASRAINKTVSKRSAKHIEQQRQQEQQ